MRLAITNTIVSGAVTSDANSSFDIADVLPFTFSENYTTNGTSATFSVNFVAGDNFTYVGIAGHNIGTLGATITIGNHDVNDVVAFAPVDDRPLMFIVPARTGGANDLTITVNKGASQVVIISHIAAGANTDLTGTSSGGQSIASDYESGYLRVPMHVARKLRTTVNDAGAPTATLIKTVGTKMRLTLSKVPTPFATTQLVTFQRFWVENGFFIQNDDDTNQSYIAFNFIPSPPKANGTTRELVSVSYSFIAHSGL